MKHAPTDADSRYEAPAGELAAVLTKLARDHAREVVAESSKLASAVRMGRLLAHSEGASELMKVAAPPGLLTRGGAAIEQFGAKLLGKAAPAARQATHDPNRIREMARQLMDAGHHDIGGNWAAYAHALEQGKAAPHGASMEFMEASLPQILKTPPRPVAHSSSMASVARPAPAAAAPSHASVAFERTGLATPSQIGKVAPGPAVAAGPVPAKSVGGAAPAAAPAKAPAKLSDSAVANMSDSDVAQNLAGGKAAPWEDMPAAVSRPTPQVAPTTAAPPTSTGAAPQAAPPTPAKQPLSNRDLAMMAGTGALGVGGIGLGGGMAMGAHQQQRPQGMPPLPPGYPQMTVTASERLSLCSLFKSAGMFANMGEGIVNAFAKKAPGVVDVAAQAAKQTAQTTAKKGMGWGTPLKIMAAGTGIGAAGAGIGAGALGVGHAVKQHQQFGTTAYQPMGPRSYMYSSQM